MTTKEDTAALWRYAEANRGKAPLGQIVDRWLQERVSEPDGKVTPDLLYAINKAGGLWSEGRFLTPHLLAQFIAKVAAIATPRSVLDPTCGCGVLLASVVNATHANVVHGADINAGAIKVARSVLGARATLTQGDVLRLHSPGDEPYDAIVADPPLGMHLSRGDVVDGLPETHRYQFDHALSVWAGAHLSDRGIAVIVVTSSFVWSSHSRGLHEGIARAGNRIRALIHLPSGTLNYTRVDAYLVVIERGTQSDVVVGQYSDDIEHQDRLVENLKRRKAGPLAALGRLCPLASFGGFPALQAEERLKRLVKQCGWRPVAGSDLFMRHEMLRDASKNKLEHDVTSCYVRLVGRPKAALRPDDLSRPGSTSRHVLHLHLAPAFAAPDFMVQWFNATDIGQASMAVFSHGTTVPMLRVTDLVDATFHLPALGTQQRMLEAASQLAAIRSAAVEVESTLWSGQRDVDDVAENIAKINHGGGIEDWLESIPFPLASILWRHEASGSTIGARYQVLLHFFEATAAFLATVHMSAFEPSDQLWNKYGRQLSTALRGQSLSLDRATFGAWKLVNEYLSSECGKLRSTRDGNALVEQAYATSNRRVLDMLADSRVRDVLQKANSIRNRTIGHGGIISGDEAKSLDNELVTLLQQLREVFGRKWANYQLVQPVIGTKRNGIHTYQARRLMGSHSEPFKMVVVESVQDWDTDELYLFDPSNQTGLRLLPFIRVQPSPEKRAEACFIFNRSDHGNQRFVSYHFAAEPEISEVDPAVDQALARLHIFDVLPS